MQVNGAVKGLVRGGEGEGPLLGKYLLKVLVNLQNPR